MRCYYLLIVVTFNNFTDEVNGMSSIKFIGIITRNKITYESIS